MYADPLTSQPPSPRPPNAHPPPPSPVFPYRSSLTAARSAPLLLPLLLLLARALGAAVPGFTSCGDCVPNNFWCGGSASNPTGQSCQAYLSDCPLSACTPTQTSDCSLLGASICSSLLPGTCSPGKFCTPGKEPMDWCV